MRLNFNFTDISQNSSNERCGSKVRKNSKGVSTYKEREQRRVAARERETLLMYKFMFVVCAAVLGIISVVTIRKTGRLTVGFYLHAQMPIVIVCAVLTLAAAVYIDIKKKNKADESGRVVTSTGLLAVAASALALFASYSFIDVEYDTARIIALIVLAALYFVYHIYNSVFFTVSMQCAVAALAIALLSRSSVSFGLRAAVAVVAVVLCSAGAYLLLKLLSKKGKAAVKDYKPYVMAAITAAGVLLSLFIPAINVYAIFAVLAVYVVIAVISTIEMM